MFNIKKEIFYKDKLIYKGVVKPVALEELSKKIHIQEKN